MKCHLCKHCKTINSKIDKYKCMRHKRDIIMDGLSGCSDGERKDIKL